MSKAVLSDGHFFGVTRESGFVHGGSTKRNIIQIMYQEEGDWYTITSRAVDLTSIIHFSYVIPMTLVSCLYRNALVTPLVPVEDVFVTGLLSQKCGAYLLGEPRMKPVDDIQDLNATNFVVFHEVTKDSIRLVQGLTI
jgi:hypothetical protein